MQDEKIVLIGRMNCIGRKTFPKYWIYMAKKNNKKRTLKNGRIRTKLTPLRAYEPLRVDDWKSKLPEMLLIVGLLEEQNVKDVVAVFRALKEFVSEQSEKEKTLEFGGTVSELAELVEMVHETKWNEIRLILRRIFCGPNLSLLKIFEIPKKEIVTELLGYIEDVKEEDLKVVMRTTGAALHGQSGRATRAKLVQLMLWDPDGKKYHLNIDEMGTLLEAKHDDVLKENICSNVRATWLAIQGCKEEDTPWVKTFWQFGLNNTPCLQWNPKKGRDRICLSHELKSLIKKIDRLWNAMVTVNPPHDFLFVSDVAMGLTCRIWRFMHHIVEASGAGNGEIAEMAARCQWDSVVTLEWLIERNDPKLFLQYRIYSAGKTKATLERFRADSETYGGDELKEKIEPKLIREIQEGVGIWEQLVNEERGGWSKETTYDMANDVSKLHEYEIYFRRLSDIVHGTWRALERYHLRKCLNPLHAGHYMAWTGATHDAGMTIVHFGTTMAARAIRALVEYMGPVAEDKWRRRIVKIEEDVKAITRKDLAQ